MVFLMDKHAKIGFPFAPRVQFTCCSIFFLLVGLVFSTNQSVCNILSTYNQLKTSDIGGTILNNYPSDVYEISVFPKKTQKYINCPALEKKNAFTPHNCSYGNTEDFFCPVAFENIDSAMEISQAWLHAGHLCTIKSHLMNPKGFSNILMFGGSVTGGRMAAGCIFNESYSFNHTTSPTCSWVGHLGTYIQSISKAAVKVHNMAASGQNSLYYSQSLGNNLKEHEINMLTSTDLLFLDFSANDQVIPKQADIEIGLETLIRRIYALSTPNSLPTIIILATCPHQKLHDRYHQAYFKVSKYYNLPLWSIADVANSTYTRQNQAHFHAYLDYKNTYGYPHPPWHVHLFFADVFAGILKREFEHCPALNTASKYKENPIIVPPRHF